MKGANVKSLWPWLLTGFTIIAAIIVFVASPDMNTKSQLGDYLGGFASTVAFIWLIGGDGGQVLKCELSEKLISQDLTP